MGRVEAASGAPRPGQRYRIARPCTSSSAIGMNRYSSRSPARRAAGSKATSIRPKGSVEGAAPRDDLRPVLRGEGRRQRPVVQVCGDPEAGVEPPRGTPRLLRGRGRRRRRRRRPGRTRASRLPAPCRKDSSARAKSRSGSPRVATIARCSSARASSGCSSKASKRPCSKSTLRVGQLGSPVVMALRARSRWTTLGSTRIVPTGPAQAARARHRAPRSTSRRPVHRTHRVTPALPRSRDIRGSPSRIRTENRGSSSAALARSLIWLFALRTENGRERSMAPMSYASSSR